MPYALRYSAIRHGLRCSMIGLLGLLSACTAVRTHVKNQYKLQSYSQKQWPQAKTKTLLITPTDAVSGYQTNDMLYINQPYHVSHFVQNAWISPPATMIYPLILESIQHSHIFHAIVSGFYTWKTDYRLDTQLITLQQNFITKPSQIELTLKATLTNNHDSHIIASRLFQYRIHCKSDTPYGGVQAANQATQAFTADLNHFLYQHSQP